MTLSLARPQLLRGANLIAGRWVEGDATSIPVTAPERNAVVSPPCNDPRAASAVRTLARTEMFMPT